MSKNQSEAVAALPEGEETAEQIRARLEAEYSPDASEESEEDSEEGTSEDTQDDEGEAASESAEETEEAPSKEQPLIMGRWKSTDDVVTSYKQLENEYARVRAELNQRASTGQSEKSDPKDRNLEFARIVADERDPVRAVENVARSVIDPVKEELERIQLETAISGYRQNKEFAELEPTMAQLAVENQALIKQTGLSKIQVIPMLFLMAKGLKADQLAKAAEERGKAKGKLKTEKKVKAQVEGASGSKGVSKKDPYTMDMKELKARIERGERD